MTTKTVAQLTPVESGLALENLVALHESVLAENKLLKAKLQAAREELLRYTQGQDDGDHDWPRRRATSASISSGDRSHPTMPCAHPADSSRCKSLGPPSSAYPAMSGTRRFQTPWMSG